MPIVVYIYDNTGAAIDEYTIHNGNLNEWIGLITYCNFKGYLKHGYDISLK